MTAVVLIAVTITHLFIVHLGCFEFVVIMNQHYCEHSSLCILIRTGVHFNRAHASE